MLRFDVAAALLASIVLGGCRHVPQNLDEQRLYIEGHRRGHVESWSAASPPEVLLPLLAERMQSCLEGHETREVPIRQSSGMITTHRIEQDFHVSVLRDPARGVDSVSVQLDANTYGPARRAPPGGVYIWHVDLRPTGGGTELTFYGGESESGEAQVATLRAWCDGQEAPCPPRY